MQIPCSAVIGEGVASGADMDDDVGVGVDGFNVGLFVVGAVDVGDCVVGFDVVGLALVGV